MKNSHSKEVVHLWELGMFATWKVYQIDPYLGSQEPLTIQTTLEGPCQILVCILIFHLELAGHCVYLGELFKKM